MKFTAFTVMATLAVASSTNALPSSAHATMLGAKVAPVTTTDVTPAQWRGGYRGWGRGYAGPRYWGGGAAVVGGVLVGSAIVAAAIAERRAEASALRACARDYRSFDYETGTYIDRDGDLRVCPYLY